MRRISLFLLVAVFCCARGERAGAAIITAVGGKRTAKTGGTAVIKTTTTGQRQIAITIDPGVTTAFRLDLLFPNDLVTLVAVSDIGPELLDEAIDYVPPYVGSGPRATLLPSIAEVGGLISNVEGRLATGLTAAPPAPNRPDGGSDLFTLYFIDKAPEETKRFTIIGVTEKGVEPTFTKFIGDNYLEALIDDPDDPLFGQIYRFSGEEIEAGTIVVDGIGGGGVDGGIPLPAAVWMGVAGAGMVWARRTRGRR